MPFFPFVPLSEVEAAGVVFTATGDPASASTVAIETDQLGKQVLVFRSAPGELNDVVVSKRQDSETQATYIVEDSAGVPSPGSGCSWPAVDVPVECVPIGDLEVEVYVGDEPDNVYVPNGAGTDPNKMTHFYAELGTGDDGYAFPP